MPPIRFLTRRPWTNDPRSLRNGLTNDITLQREPYSADEFRSIYAAVGLGGLYYEASDDIPFVIPIATSRCPVSRSRRLPPPISIASGVRISPWTPVSPIFHSVVPTGRADDRPLSGNERRQSLSVGYPPERLRLACCKPVVVALDGGQERHPAIGTGQTILDAN